jgi:hypothetical protein
MTGSEDEWPLPRYYITDQPKHIHALGVVSLTYNLFESRWITILAHYAGQATADFLLTGKISDEARMRYVRHYVQLKERDPIVIDLIENAIHCYATCGENRNILMHSSQFFHRAHLDRLSLIKQSSKGSVLKFHFHLDEIRRVADDIMEGYFRIVDILDFIEDRDAPAELMIGARSALPNIPLSPRKLSPAEILEAPQAGQPQPGSSPE